jgi:methyl-accepting chemotaxis protein
MKNASIGVRLIGGYVLVALITLALGFIGWRGVGQMNQQLEAVGKERLPAVQSLLTMKSEFYRVVIGVRSLLSPELSMEERNAQYALIASARENYKAAYKAFESISMAPEEAAAFKEFVDQVGVWKKANDVLLQAAKDVETTGILNPNLMIGNLAKIRVDHYNLMGDCDKMIISQTTFQGGDDPTACALGKWMASFKTDNPRIQSAIKEIKTGHDAFHELVGKIKKFVNNGERESAARIYDQEIGTASAEIVKHLGVITTEAETARKHYETMVQQALGPSIQNEKDAIAKLDRIIDKVVARAQTAVSSGDAVVGHTRLISLIGMIAGVCLALIIGILLTLSISRPLRRVIEGLSETSGQVAEAAMEVSSSSQQLADGASRQSAAIEQTASSTEEMASMTRNNADNAAQADGLMKDANKVAAQANDSMGGLTASMNEITHASEETQKIIKTIDEIAFQTNLLALNAAVEAARAGEAGAGFAVVADEVRSLAMRAAEAAKNTASLIEDTVKRIKAGSERVNKTNEEFSSVSTSMVKVGQLVGEIAAASKEQAQGIEQVNQAISEMDKVVQTNAANAEESASASEEMNAQAIHLKSYIGDLEVLVGGRNASGSQGLSGDSSPLGKKSAGLKPKGSVNKLIARAGAFPKEMSGKALPQPGNKKGKRPDQIIPLDDDEFVDF